jgi:hypothetical protein
MLAKLERGCLLRLRKCRRHKGGKEHGTDKNISRDSVKLTVKAA